MGWELGVMLYVGKSNSNKKYTKNRNACNKRRDKVTSFNNNYKNKTYPEDSGYSENSLV